MLSLTPATTLTVNPLPVMVSWSRSAQKAPTASWRSSRSLMDSLLNLTGRNGSQCLLVCTRTSPTLCQPHGPSPTPLHSTNLALIPPRSPQLQMPPRKSRQLQSPWLRPAKRPLRLRRLLSSQHIRPRAQVLSARRDRTSLARRAARLPCASQKKRRRKCSLTSCTRVPRSGPRCRKQRGSGAWTES